jgi:hypothetical protein
MRQPYQNCRRPRRSWRGLRGDGERKADRAIAGRCIRRVESVEIRALLELRARVAPCLPTYGAFEGCTAEDQRTILAQASSSLSIRLWGSRGG